MLMDKSISKVCILFVVLLSLVITALFLVGCSSSSGFRESEEFDSTLRVTLSSPTYRYEVGETVTFTVVLENISGQPLRLVKPPKGPKYGFDVEVEDNWLSDHIPELQVETQEVEPGEEIEVTFSFLPEQKAHLIAIDVYIYYHFGDYSLIQQGFSLNYGVKRY